MGQRQRAPHPATVQRAQEKAPHPAMRPANRPPHPATVQRRGTADAGGRPPHAATVVQRRVGWWEGQGAIQRARDDATMVDLHGAEPAKQDELAWCYASVMSVISGYLNNGAGWTPCQIASWAVNQNRFGGEADQHLLASVCNCCKGSNQRSAFCKGAEAVSPLGIVLNHLNITCTTTQGNLSWSALQTEIDAGRPIVLSLVRNDNRPGHVAMIIGYEQVPRVPDHPEQGSTAYAIVFDPAGQNTEYSGSLDNATWTLRVPFVSLLGSYPVDNGKYSIGSYRTNFQQAQALPQAPAWAVYV